MSDEERIEQLEAEVKILRRQVERIQLNLKALGVQVPPLESNPRTELDPDVRLKGRQHLAARARAAKPVGLGKGSVRSHEVKTRLEEQARRFVKGRKKGAQS